MWHCLSGEDAAVDGVHGGSNLDGAIHHLRCKAWSVAIGSGGYWNTAERNGQRFGSPVLLSGMVVEAGLVELSAGPLGKNSRSSLELLTLLVLQLVVPLMASLMAMSYEQPPAISSLMVDLDQTQKALQATLNNTTK